MSAWPWLLGAAIAGAGAFAAGRPAWGAYRTRMTRDTNAERYLAWRGRADRSVDPSMTQRERRRLVVAGLLALVAVFCLVGFLSYA
jgi:hypothetical protein